MVLTTTAFTLFKLVYGFKSVVPSALREAPTVQYNYENYLTELRGRLQSFHEVARQKLLSSKEKTSIMIDSETLEVQVGQKVLLFDETVRRSRSRKLSPQYVGPYEVLAIRVNVIKMGVPHEKCV
jgi:hypothetical protein